MRAKRVALWRPDSKGRQGYEGHDEVEWASPEEMVAAVGLVGLGGVG